MGANYPISTESMEEIEEEDRQRWSKQIDELGFVLYGRSYLLLSDEFEEGTTSIS